VVVANAGAAQELPGARTVRPGDRLTVAGVEIEAVPAYNVNKFRSPGVPFHPREAEHVGYVVTVGGVRVYFSGDTDPIPEQAEIDCHVALLPVSGIYVMTAEEAAEAARTLDPQIVVPMHYGAGIGTGEDGRRFTELYEGEVALLEVE
jgi:L-ascorbate metabolism protein UlaG (beta-lactamase superfamily)